MRASLIAEQAGVRGVSIVTRPFPRQAQTVARSLARAEPSIAEYPGLPMTDSPEQFLRNVTEVLVEHMVTGLATPTRMFDAAREPAARRRRPEWHAGRGARDVSSQLVDRRLADRPANV
jgi:hypothetical protein